VIAELGLQFFLARQDFSVDQRADLEGHQLDALNGVEHQLCQRFNLAAEPRAEAALVGRRSGCAAVEERRRARLVGGFRQHCPRRE